MNLLAVSLSQASSLFGWKGNALVGISTGYGHLQGSLQTSLQYNLPLGFPPTTIINDYSDNGWVIGLLAGYQAVCDQWLMGGEINFEHQSIARDHAFAFTDPANRIGWNASARYQRHFATALTGRIGYAITSYFLPYIRLGAEVGRDQLQTTFSGNPLVYPVNISIQDKRWIYRFLSGLGAEFPLPCIPAAVRVEYNFHSKGKTLETDGAIIDGVVNPVFMSNMQPKMQVAKLALVWNLG